MELLDHPHPLDTLGEVGSYGPEGAISRFHNPDNYTRALGGVLRARAAPWRGLLSSARQPAQHAQHAQRQEDSPSALAPAVAAGGGLWFMPRKGTQKVRKLLLFIGRYEWNGGMQQDEQGACCRGA
jgi:hypothetical protein